MSLTAEDARRLQQCLQGEGVAVLPTDTVYGLACNPASERAIERLYELKGRPARKPSAVMFFSLEAALRDLPELGARTAAALRALLPGPVTLLLANPHGRYPLASGVAPVAPHEPTAPLGLRVPLLDGPLAALADVSVPALQSSANLSGGPDPRRLEDVPAELREGADLVLDGGGLGGAASTVVDLSRYDDGGAWRVVREGPVTAPELERLLS
ncbi:MAG: L-threonylcarbamoyladenylate synthase [Solirubrobacteraceae bacterium]